jgi:glucose/arabinose dehydrogenase
VNDTLLTGLTEPTSMAFLPDGRLLITERRTGKVRLFVGGHIAASDPVLVVPGLIANTYERGLQGVAVDPGWPQRPYVYLYYNRAGGFCRLVRYRAAGDLSDPAGESLALGDSLLLLDDIPDNNGDHNSGCLRFGPGDHLFVSLGDDEFLCGAADSTSLRGAILRLDVSRLPDGPGGQVPRALITPAMNPLVAADSIARLVWAYGMRNPVAPNPFRGATRLALHLSARRTVTLALYDVAGRRVRVLFRGEAPAGESEFEWDGRDDLGRPASAGLYLARLEGAHMGPHTATLLRLW